MLLYVMVSIYYFFQADCPSPLVKAPLKRSNSCSVRRTGDPPLLPRPSQVRVAKD